MSFAQDYTPTVSFATEETNSVAGRSTVRTTAVDTELANVSSSIIALNTNLKKLQRDDGKLSDGLIEPYALSEQSRALIASGGTPRGNWLSGQSYAVGDAVQYSATVYLCHTAHTSTVSFASGLFMAISGDGSSFVSAAEAAASAAEAAISASNSSTSASTALTASNNAQTYANNASGFAIASQNSATAAASSAATAASVIASSTAGASQAEAEAGIDNSKYMSPLRVKQAITANKVIEIGYFAGNGGTSTQSGNKGNPVTLNKLSGMIQTDNASLAANARATFTLNNSQISATDCVIINIKNTFSGYSVEAKPFSGGAVIILWNWTGSTLAESVQMNFAVIKGSTT